MLRMARRNVMIRSDVWICGRRDLIVEGINQIAVRRDIFQSVEGRRAAFESSGLDIVGRACIGVGAKCAY